jgi:hypothetical protein
MGVNPSLKRRIKRKKNLVGKVFDYFPQAVSANKTITVGEKVRIRSEPEGKNEIVKVTSLHSQETTYVKLSDLTY